MRSNFWTAYLKWFDIIVGMDLEPFHRSVYQLILTIVAAVSTTFTSPSDLQINLQNPGVITAYNILEESLNIDESESIQLDTEDKINQDTSKVEKIKLVIKESDSTPTPTPSPIPSPVKKATPIPKETTEPKQTNDIALNSEANKETKTGIELVNQNLSGSELLFQMANQHRAKLGLGVFEKDEKICQIAQQRAPQVYGEVFTAGPMHKGFYALNLPYWAAENIASYQTIEENFNFWIADYIHRKAIEGDYKYSCVACFGNSCSQIFTSYIPKKN